MTVLTADLNGDGREDLVHVRTNNGGKLIFIPYLANGAGGFVPQPLYDTGVHYSGGEQTLVTVLATDINGDGRQDLVHVRTDGNLLIFIPYLSNGAGGFVPQAIYRTGVHYNGGEQTLFTVLATDLNGDGRQDLVHVRTNNGGKLIFIPYLSDGTGGFVPQPLYDTGDHYNGGEPTLVTVLTADLNGDGRQDLVHVRTNNGGSLQFRPHLSNGAGGFVAQNIYDTGVHYNGGEPTLFTVLTADLNGDGRQDLVHVRTNNGGRLIFIPHLLNGPAPDLLTTIANGLGSTSTIAYVPSTTYSNTQLPFPVQVVSVIATDDGDGVISTTRYTYVGGFYSLGERDFRGFQNVIVSGLPGPNGEQTVTETWFHQGNDTAVDVNNPDVPAGYMKGKPYRVRVSDRLNQRIAETTTSYAPDDSAPYFNPPLQVEQASCESGTCAKRTRVVYTYDSNYGNLT